MYGSDTAPFEARLTEDADGNYLWKTDSAMPESIAETLELAQEGKSRKEIPPLVKGESVIVLSPGSPR